MNYNFCTLFDKKYILNGLALYNSLLSHVENFNLFVLCLDDETFNLLYNFNFKNIVLFSLSEIEDSDLLLAKNNRTKSEYYWTLASFFTNYVLKNNPDINHIAYLDSDLYFFSSPQLIYEELGDKSILIIKHNYVPRLNYLNRKGIYNVGMVIFKNDEVGRKCLEDWKDQCLFWCYDRDEEKRFGDQKYLDYWLEQYKKVHVLKNKGGGVAPWNVEKYELIKKNNQIFVDEDELIFYHFHTFKIIGNNKFIFHSSFYSLNDKIINLIYNPYVEEIKKSVNAIKSIDLDFNYSYNSSEGFLDRMKQKFKRFLFLVVFYIKK